MNNNQNIVKNFYEEDIKYQQKTEEIKRLIERILKIDSQILLKKIEEVNENNRFDEFFDLLEAVIGKETDKYMCCEDEEDVKYHGLEIGHIYRIDKLDLELQNKYSNSKKLKLQSREKLAKELKIMAIQLIFLFEKKVYNEENISFIEEKDLVDLIDIKNYVSMILDDSNKFKILEAEKIVFEQEEKNNNKNGFKKWILGSFEKNEVTIDKNVKRKR